MNSRFVKAALLAVLFVMVAVLVMPVVTPVAAQRGAARPQVLLPDGPLRPVIRKNCTSCHGIDDYAFYALDKAGWQSLLENKHKVTGGYSLADNDQTLLLDWLVSKFGASSKPFPRSYVPPEITTFFSDPEGNRLLARACSTCHDLERVNVSRKTEEGWRVLAVDMRERGATLTDQELEQLVEWLARVKGTNQNQ